MQMQFDLQGLAAAGNGQVAMAFGVEVARIVQDMHDRPTEEKPRVLNVSVKFVPQATSDDPDNAVLDSVLTIITVTSNVPKRESSEFRMRATGETLVWQEASPRDPSQAALPFNLGTDKKPEADAI